MKQIIPFDGTQDALVTLDNGGRFYNLFTKANDGSITPQEVGKVAGVFNSRQQSVLYLSLAISTLDPLARGQIILTLSEDMKLAYEKYLPQQLLPSEAVEKGVIAANVIVTGIPKKIDAKSDLLGFVMIPPAIMVPIIDSYDVYEMRDDATSQKLLIAHTRGEAKLPETTIKVAGVLKQIKVKEDGVKVEKLFLEAQYYTDKA